MINKKAQFDNREWGLVIIAVLIGLIVGYFIWGESYTSLNNKYKSLVDDYYELNQSYNSLQQNYTKLEQECKQVLIRYEACVGRETFFVWVDRFFTLKNLAKLIGLI